MSGIFAYLREVVSRNAAMKTVSIVLACIVWYATNVSERDAERVVELPLALRQVPRNLVVTDWPRDPVFATLRGPRPLLDGVDEPRSRFILKVGVLDAGENWLDLKAGRLDPELPHRLNLVRLEPGRVLIQAESLKKRSLPVRATVVGTPAFGFRRGSVSVSPDRVEVSGPVAEVDELKELATIPVDVGGLEVGLQRRALVEWVGDFVTFVPDRVTVTVDVNEMMMTREFEDIAVRVAGREDGRLEPRTVSLTLRGPQRILHEYTLAAGAAYVDATTLEVGSHQVEVLVDVPAEVEIVTREPDIHTIIIGEEKPS